MGGRTEGERNKEEKGSFLMGFENGNYPAEVGRGAGGFQSILPAPAGAELQAMRGSEPGQGQGKDTAPTPQTEPGGLWDVGSMPDGDGVLYPCAGCHGDPLCRAEHDFCRIFVVGNGWGEGRAWAAGSQGVGRGLKQPPAPNSTLPPQPGGLHQACTSSLSCRGMKHPSGAQQPASLEVSWGEVLRETP